MFVCRFPTNAVGVCGYAKLSAKVCANACFAFAPHSSSHRFQSKRLYMKTKHWILLFLSLAIVAIIAQLFILRSTAENAVALIYHDGILIKSVVLADVEGAFTFSVTTADSENIILIESGRISMAVASCPDQICVRQGVITNGVRPIVCLPNRLKIRIINAENEAVDIITGIR